MICNKNFNFNNKNTLFECNLKKGVKSILMLIIFNYIPVRMAINMHILKFISYASIYESILASWKWARYLSNILPSTIVII